MVHFCSVYLLEPNVPPQYTFFIFFSECAFQAPYGSWAPADQSTAVAYSVAPGTANTIRNIKNSHYGVFTLNKTCSWHPGRLSDAFIQNTDCSIHSHMNYRSIMDCFCCVEGIRLTTVVLRALTHWSIHTNYLCLGVESEFNIQFTQFNRTSERPTEKKSRRQKSHNGQKQCVLFLRGSQLSPKWKKEAG